MDRMNTRRWRSAALSVWVMTSLILVGCAPIAAPAAAAPVAQNENEIVQYVAVPYVPPPDYLASDEPTEEELRAQLIAIRQDLCQDLELASSLILNTGVLTAFPGKIQGAAGMGITALEEELKVCNPADDTVKSTAQLVNEVHKAEWLVKLHLTALESATMEQATLRPINADGSVAAFLTLHDVLILQMRAALVALTDGSPTLEEAQAMGVFWQEVLVAHAQAEDEALFPIARAAGNPTLIRSADMIAQEHGPIEDAIERYMSALARVEADQAEIEEVVPLAREVRALTELHFGREEATVIRPLQVLLTDEQFRPAVEAQDVAIGSWLRQHGWQGM
jgi:hypothetical protein